MNVKELAEWLQRFQDQDAEVLIVRHTCGTGCYDQGGNATEEPFDPDYTEYTDFRGNQFVKPDAPYFNRRYLLLGVYNG